MQEVEKLLRLPRSTIRALIDAGFVSPTRGPRNAWLFSFQDLIVLRTAQALALAKVPQKRITRSIRAGDCASQRRFDIATTAQKLQANGHPNDELCATVRRPR